jgi:hypothetical protein
MSITRIAPPVDYLRSASRSSLQSFELARLNHAANLRREIAILMDQWLEETAEAMLARWMIDHHGALREPALSVADLLRTFKHPGIDPIAEISQPTVDISQPPVEVLSAPPRFAETGHRLAGTPRSKLHK